MLRVLSSLYAEGDRAKYFEFPSAVYAMHPFDEVRNADGKVIGVSTWVGYSSNEGKMLTLAMIDGFLTMVGGVHYVLPLAVVAISYS